MKPFRYAHAAADDWRGAVDQVIDGLGSGAGTLGLVYVTDAVNANVDDIIDALRETTDVPHWVGAVGIGICATGVEYYDQPAIAAMITDLPTETFRVFPPVVEDLRAFDAAQVAWLGNATPYLGLVHADPGNAETESLLTQLAARTATGFLVGGMASAHDQALVIAERAAKGGIAGVMFTDAVGIQTNLTQGCTPIGPHRRITEVQRNILVTLDNRPALDVFIEDIGEDLAQDISQVGGLIFAGLPIQGSDTGDYLVRNLLGVDMNQKLLAIGELVETGQEIMFCRRDADSAQEDLSRMLAHLKSRLDGPPRGGIYVSCLGRGVNLFGEEGIELEQIRMELGDFPLVGFYANGEVSRDRLYGYTGVLTLFT